jgi:hypothetical protein
MRGMAVLTTVPLMADTKSPSITPPTMTVLVRGLRSVCIWSEFDSLCFAFG